MHAFANAICDNRDVPYSTASSVSVPYRSLALYTEISSSACVTYYLSVVIHKSSISVYKSARVCVAINGEERGKGKLNILK